MKDVSITLVNESCFSFLKELESNSIDLALIDPPYEVSRETNFKSGEAKGKDTDRFRVSMDFGDWDSDFTGLDEVIKELYRVLRKGGTIICFYDIWKISILRNSGKNSPSFMWGLLTEVCICLFAFSFTENTDADFRLLQFASHYSTSSTSTLGVAPYFPTRYPLRMFSVVLVEKSLMLYSSEAPSSLFLSTK